MVDKIVFRQELQERVVSSPSSDFIPRCRIKCCNSEKGDIFSSILIFTEFTEGEPLSIEALTPAQAGFELMACVANGRHLQDHGFFTISTLCRKIPALRITYGELGQLGGGLDRLLSIIAHFSLGPAELHSLVAPFNRIRLQTLRTGHP